MKSRIDRIINRDKKIRRYQAIGGFMIIIVLLNIIAFVLTFNAWLIIPLLLELSTFGIIDSKEMQRARQIKKELKRQRHVYSRNNSK